KTLVVLSYYQVRGQAGPPPQDTLITGWDTSTRKQVFRRRRPGTDSWTALSADARVLAVPHSEGSRVPREGPGKGPMRLGGRATAGSASGPSRGRLGPWRSHPTGGCWHRITSARS